MKTKLLKKSRKRFTITHHSNGKISSYDNEHHNYNFFELVDNQSSYNTEHSQLYDSEAKSAWTSNRFDTEKECIDFLKEKILSIIRNEYTEYSVKRKNFLKKSKKVWYIQNV